MATIAGSIKSLTNGSFSAKDENGNIRVLKVGDEIYENDTVYGDSGNSASSQVEIQLSGNDIIVLSEGQKQLIDSSLIETAFGTEELFFTIDGIDLKADESNSGEDVVSDLRDAGFTDDKKEVDEEAALANADDADITEEETAAGEEVAEDGTDVQGIFQDRDGDATNVVSDLRDAQFVSSTQTTLDNASNIIIADLSVDDVVAYEDDGFLVFTVSLDRAVSGDVTFNYSTSPITATANGTDYTDVSGTITIPAGSTSVTIRVPVTDDYIADNGETININITDVDGNANVVKPDGIGTILDNTIQNNPEENVEAVVIKVFAADENGNPLEDVNGNYLTVNETPEGGDTYYVALAFAPETTEFNDTTKLDVQEGTVDFTFTSDTATTSTSGVEGTNDYSPQTDLSGIALGTAVKSDALDDYMADDGETFDVTIDNYTSPTTPAYEDVEVKTDGVETTITDNSNPNTPNNPSDGPETSVEKVVIKVFAADENGNPLEDVNGNYLTVNETPEGGDTYYVALAFAPETTEFNDTTKLDVQEGTVDFTFTSDTATTSTSGVEGTNDYSPQTDLSGIALGTAVKSDALDDYMADDGETFDVTIDNYTSPTTPAYEDVEVKTDGVETTITDNSNPNTPNNPSDGPETSVEKVVIKVFAADENGNPLEDVNGNYLTVNETPEGGDTYYVALAFAPETTEFNDTTKLDVQEGTVDFTFTSDTATTSTSGVEGTNDYSPQTDLSGIALGTAVKSDALDDYMADDGETFDVTIDNYTSPTTPAYEDVEVKTDGVETTITDNSNPNTPNNPSDGPETSVEKVVIKVFAADENGNPLEDVNGNYLTVNETPEGGDTYYVALAFAPETTEFNDTTKLDVQEGTVDFTFTSDTATTSTSGVEGTNDYSPQTDLSGIALGTAVKSDALDDYMADDGETFDVTIDNYTSPTTPAYEDVEVKTDGVETTITDNSNPNTPNNPSDGPETSVEKVVIKVFAADENGNPLEDVNGNYLTVNETPEGGDTYYVALAFAPETTEFNDTTKLDVQEGTVDFTFTSDTATTSTSGVEGTNDYSPQTDLSGIALGTAVKSDALDDYMADDGETFDVTIDNYTSPTTPAYEDVEVKTDGVETTITDNSNPNTPNNPSDGPETSVEKVVIKVFAADENGNPLEDVNGNYLTVNETPEGGDTYYVALAFAPETTEFNDTTKLDVQEGTVDFTFTSDTATTSTSGVEGTNDYSPQTDLSGIALGTAVKSDALDDYMADDGETFDVTIDNYTSPTTPAYEDVEVKTDGVETTITDNSNPNTPNNPSDGPETSVEKVVIKVFAADENGNPLEDVNGNYLTVNETPEGGDTYYVALAFAPETTEFNDTTKLDVQEGTVDFTFTSDTATTSTSGVEGTNDYSPQTDLSGIALGTAVKSDALDDYMADDGETFDVTIDNYTSPTTPAYEDVEVKTDGVETTITDNSNPNTPNNPSDGPETSVEKVVIKVFAADENGNPLEDVNGNYLTVNETPEGGDTYYVALAFAPETTEFNDTTKLDVQEGTVDFTFTSDTATTSTSGVEGTNDYSPQTDLSGIALGTAVKSDALDDYMADDGETFDVTIDNYTSPTTPAYEDVEVKTDGVETTITDNSNPNTPNNPSDGPETSVEKVVIKVFAADENGNPLEDVNGNYLTVNETPEGGDTYYVALAFAPETTEFNDTTKLDVQEGTVDFTFTSDTATTSTSGVEGTNDYSPQTDLSGIALGTAVKSDALDDYMADDGETFDVTIDNYTSPTTPAYEDVEVKTDGVETTITDNSNPNTPNNPSDGPETSVEKVVIKVFAADENGNPLEDVNGNYLTVNETPEGGDTYYVALAFAPETTEFNDTTKLDVQEGTVDFTFTSDTATTSTSGVEGTNDYSPQTDLSGIALGTAVKSDALDDYMADDGETFDVTIDNYTSPTTPAYEDVEVKTDGVETTITDNPADVKQDDNGTGNDNSIDGNYDQDDTVYVQITDNASVIEGNDLVHNIQLVDSEGNNVIIPSDETITVTLTYNTTTGTIDANDIPNTSTEYAENSTITIILDSNTPVDENGIYTLPITNTTLDDFVAEGNENYTLTITDIVQSGAFENVVIGDVDGNNKSVTGTIEDGVIVGAAATGIVYEDALVNDIKSADDANNLTYGEEITSALTSEASLNITNPNNDTYTVTFKDYNDTEVSGNFATITSEGQDVTIIINSSGELVGTRTDGEEVFTVAFDKSDATKYTMTLSQPIDHTPANDGYDTLNIPVDYIVSSDGSSIEKTLNIAVVDSAPTLENETIVLSEDSIASSSENTFALADEFVAGEGSSALTLAGVDITTTVTSIKVNESGAAVTDGSEIGTLTSNGDGSVSFVPVEDYSGTVTVNYTVTDYDGDISTSQLTFDTTPTVDFVAPTLTDLEVNEDAKDEDETQDTQASPLELVIPNISDLLSSGTDGDYASAEFDDDRSETVGDITINDIPTGAILAIKGSIVTPTDGSYTLTDFDYTNDTVTIIPPKDSDDDFILTYTFTVTDTATLSRGEVTDTKDYSIDQKIIVHGIADDVSIDSLNSITVSEQEGTDKANAWFYLNEIVADSNVSYGDSSDSSEIHLIRIDGITDTAYFLSENNTDLNQNGVLMNQDRGSDIPNSEDYFQIIHNDDGTSSIIVSLDYVDSIQSNNREAMIRIPDSDEDLTLTVTAISIEQEFIDNIDSSENWYDAIDWTDNDTGADDIDNTSSYMDTGKGYEIDSDTVVLTVDASIDISLDDSSTTEDTAVKFLSSLKVTDTDSGNETIQKVIIKGIQMGSTLSDGTVLVDSDGDGFADDVTYLIIPAEDVTSTTPANTLSLSALQELEITPPAHSSTDMDLIINVTVKDNDTDSFVDAVTGQVIEGGSIIDKDYTTTIEVTPVAEVTTSDSDGDGVNDVTLTAGHTYHLTAAEDGSNVTDDTISWFNLGLEDTFNLKDNWSNEDDTATIGDESHTTDQTDSEETFAHLTFTINENGTYVETSGAQYRYDTTGNDDYVTVTDTGSGVDIPVKYLDTLEIIAPAQLSGDSRIEVQAKTVDYDENNGDSVESLSGLSYLTFTVDAVADDVTVAIKQSFGDEDSAIALDVDVTSEDTDGSESYTITLHDIPDGGTITYNGQVIDINSSTFTSGSAESTGQWTGSNYEITITDSDTGDGTWELTITNFDSDAELSYTPALNSNNDVTILVDASSVDSNSVSTPIENLQIKINVDGVADHVINTTTTSESIDDVANVSHDYNAIIHEGTTAISIISLFSDTNPLSMYDNDGSETLYVTVDTSSFPDGVALSGTNMIDIGNGKYIMERSDFDSASVNIPTDYNGEIDFSISLQTSENDGDLGDAETIPLTVLVTPETDGTISTSQSQNEDTTSDILDFTFIANGDEKLESYWINTDNLPDGVTLSGLGGLNTDGTWVELEVNSNNEITTEVTANLDSSWHDKNGSYDFEVRYSTSDTTTDTDGNTYTDKSTASTYSDELDNYTTQTYTVNVNAVTDTASSLITIESTDTTNATVDGTTITVSDNTTFTVPFTLSTDDMSIEGSNGKDLDGSESITSITISGVPEGVSIYYIDSTGTQVLGTQEGDLDGYIYAEDDNGDLQLVDSGEWTISVTNSDITADDITNNIVFVVDGEAVKFNGITTKDEENNISIKVTHQDTGSEVLTNTETFTLDVTGNLEDGSTNVGTDATVTNVTGDPMVITLTSNNSNETEDEAFSLGNLITATTPDTGKFVIQIAASDLPDGYTLSGVSSTTTEDGEVIYHVMGEETGAGEIQALIDSITVTPNANDNKNTTISNPVFAVSIIAFNAEGDNEQVTYSVDDATAILTPVTDPLTVNVSSTTISESDTPDADTDGLVDNAQTVTVSLTANSVDSGVIIQDGKIYVKFTESITDDTNEPGLITSIDGNTTYNIGEWYEFIGDINTVLEFSYNPPVDHYGTLSVEAKVTSQETDATNWIENTGTGGVTITAVNEGITNLEVSAVGLEDSIVYLDVADGIAFSDDETESISKTVVLSGVTDDFEVYYKGALQTGTVASSTYDDVTGTIVYTYDYTFTLTGDMTDIANVTAQLETIGAKPILENWSGTLSDVTLTVQSGEEGTGKTDTKTFDFVFNPDADSLVSMIPTKTFGDEYTWVNLNLNVNVEDVDGSETLTVILNGNTDLNDTMIFQLNDGSAVTSSFDDTTKEWTLSDISYDDINDIQLMYTEYNDDINVTVKTVDTATGLTTSTLSDADDSEGTFNLNLEKSIDITTGDEDNNIMTDGNDTIDAGAGFDTIILDAGASIDFTKLENIEKIDLTNDSADTLNNLTLSDVVNMTDSNNELKIIGDDSEDSVSFKESDGWTKDANTVTEDGKTFDVYSNSDDTNSVQVKVEQPISDGVTN